jgi:hypothetical protein
MANSRIAKAAYFSVIGLMGVYAIFHAGRAYEVQYYENKLEAPYPLGPQSYFGGIKVNHLKFTW